MTSTDDRPQLAATITPGRRLLPLLICVAIVMLGVGITASVLPFYAERLAQNEGTLPSRVGIHVTALTSVYALMQLCFAPFWGSLSDRIGRRPLLVVGIGGFALSQALFGVATTMPILYGVRALGGVLSAALLPSATAYVADMTAESDRARGMAWFNLAAGIGTMVGPALGGILARRSPHIDLRSGFLHLDAFSVPFLAAAVVSLLALVVALRSLPRRATPAIGRNAAPSHPSTGEGTAVLLGTGFALQAGIMLFEATFTLFGQQRLGYGPTEAGMVFMACGIVMLPLQFVGVALAKRIGELRQMAAGFGLMGAGFLVLVAAAGASGVAMAVMLLGAGMAFVLPVSPSLISKRSAHGAGRAMGGLSAAQSAGQVAGSVLGGLMLGWGDRVPYWAAGASMLVLGLALGTRITRTDSAARA